MGFDRHTARRSTGGCLASRMSPVEEEALHGSDLWFAALGGPPDFGASVQGLHEGAAPRGDAPNRTRQSRRGRDLAERGGGHQGALPYSFWHWRSCSERQSRERPGTRRIFRRALGAL